MNSQDLELKLLQQQHVRKLFQLEQQRALLTSEHPVQQKTQELASSRKSSYYKPQPTIEKLLYGKPNSIQTARLIPHIPKQIDIKIAGRSMEAILRTWDYSKKLTFDDIYLKKLQDKQRQDPLQKEITLYGKFEIEEMLDQAKKADIRKGVKPFRSRYQRETIEQKLSNLYQHIQKVKKLEDQ